MSAKASKKPAKDHRPKVISFLTPLNGLDIVSRQNILWPCNAFNITIPQKKKSGLNVFEETVLKITMVESGNTVNIASHTCLGEELVTFIQNRLKQLGFLNNRYEITEEGENLLESWLNKGDPDIEYVTGTVFVDLHSGRVISYIHIGDLKKEKIISVEGTSINVQLGSSGKPKEERCRLVALSKASFWKATPNPRDIIKAIREFKKNHKRSVYLNNSFDKYPPSIPSAEGIIVNDMPELIYLHCEALIQKGNTDLLVTDGCGMGFSESFADYLSTIDQEWIIRLKQRGVIDKLGSEGGRESSLNSHGVYKFKEISRRVKSVQSSLGKIKALKPGSTNDEKEYKREIEFGIKNLYAGLEWALRQVVSDNPVSEWEKIFKNQNFRENERLLNSFSQRIGFSVTEENRYFLRVNAGAIRQIESGAVEFQSLLALAIVGASNNANHSLNTLAKNHPEFLDHARRLKKLRDPIEHGGTDQLEVDMKLLEELYECTEPMILLLVPGVSDDLQITGITTPISDVNQDRLKASISLGKALGATFLFKMSNDDKEQLTRSEIMIEQYSDEKAIEIIKCFSSVMQSVLHRVKSDLKLEGKSERLREKAIAIIVHVGFFNDFNQAPKSLTTVSPRRVESATEGFSPSLGANLLAVFLLGSETELIRIRNLYPELVSFVDNLIKLRKHGNEVLSGYSLNDIELLRKDLFKAIKAIMEVF